MSWWNVPTDLVDTDSVRDAARSQNEAYDRDSLRAEQTINRFINNANSVAQVLEDRAMEIQEAQNLGGAMGAGLSGSAVGRIRRNPQISRPKADNDIPEEVIDKVKIEIRQQTEKAEIMRHRTLSSDLDTAGAP